MMDQYQDDTSKRKNNKDVRKSKMCNQCDLVFLEKQSEGTFKNTYWRKVKQMQPMSLCLFSGEQFEDTFENTQWRKIKQMQPM